MEYVLGIAAGAVYGGTVGILKYFFLWKRVLKDYDKTITMKMVSKRLMLSFVINAITIAAVLIFKNSETVDFVAFAVTTAIALSIMGRFFSVQKVLKNVEIKDDIS